MLPTNPEGSISLNLVNSIECQFLLTEVETYQQKGFQHLHALSQHQNARFVNLPTS